MRVNIGRARPFGDNTDWLDVQDAISTKKAHVTRAFGCGQRGGVTRAALHDRAETGIPTDRVITAHTGLS